MGLSINTLLVIAVTILVVLVGIRAYRRKSLSHKSAPPATRMAQPQRKAVARNRFRAVSIAAPGTACAAAKALADKRFLVADNIVPALPLGDCDAANCACTYAHHKDRREEGMERRGPTGLRTQLHADTGNTERRKKRGRRSTDRK